MSPRVYGSAKNRILDAAEELLVRGGIGGFSVEAVAKKARTSKGGFFHHFATKEALLAAILERLAADMDARMTRLAERDRHGKGRRLRAYVQLALDLPPAERERLRALVLALILASLDRGEAVAAGARAANAEALRQAVDDGVPVGRALVAQLALDGYWLAESLGTMVLDARQKAAFRAELLALTDRPPAPRKHTKAARNDTKPPRRRS